MLKQQVILEKNIKVNNKDTKSNKTNCTKKSNGEERTNTLYHRHQARFESEDATTKLNQLDLLIQDWVVGYDDMVVVYSSVKMQPALQVQLINPRFKPVRSSNYKEIRQDPLSNLGITVTRDINTKTYYYHIPL